MLLFPNQAGTLVCAVLIAAPALCAQAAPAKQWFKGNTHTHTMNSPDGDATLVDVANWYRQNNYNFIVITDHNSRTDVEEANKLLGQPGRFLLIPGEEVTDRFDQKEVHLSAIGIRETVVPRHGESVAKEICADRKAIAESAGIAVLNHPNYTWAVEARDILACGDLLLFEVQNGSWSVGNFGAFGTPSHEELWDAVLSAGKRLYGVGSDDSHNFHQYVRGYPYPPTVPGTAWINVRASRLDPEAIRDGLMRGDFYASNGVALDDVGVVGKTIRISIHVFGENRYTTTFIGAGGRVLARTADVNPAYTIQGSEKYVRARIQDSTGHYAWTQPVFVQDIPR